MNPMDMFQNMGEIQAKVQEAQAKLRSLSVTGNAGGGMVQVSMNGEFAVTEVKIAPEVVDPQDVGMLQDLVRAAHTDAARRVREELQGNLGALMGNMSFPPGLFGGTPNG